MTRRSDLTQWLAALAASVLLASPAARAGTAQTEDAMKTHGLSIERITPDHRVILVGGVAIDGDARLAAALAEGGVAIREIVVLERMPPVYVVTYGDGEVRRYHGRRLVP